MPRFPHMRVQGGPPWRGLGAEPLAGGTTRALLLMGTALSAAAFGASAQVAPNARPTGGAVSAGQATIGGNASTTQINQQSQNAVINWQTYNVGSAQTVQYQQPNARSFALNRVLTADPSIIAGRITANGQIAIVNQSGVLFAKGSQVDTAGLVVSAANITDADFMAGRMVFSQAARPGAIVSNAGNITVRQAGLAALVAPQVANSGTITAALGRVVLGGAATHTLDLYGDGLTALNVTGQVTQASIGGRKVPALVTNTGTILAPGGTVVLTAAAADGVVTTLVSAGGVIAANSVGAQTGRVLVQGVGGGVTIDGQVSATGAAAGTVGGQVVANATGGVTVAAGAVIDVSGNAGGGLIAVGTTAARAAGGSKVAATMMAQTVSLQAGAVLRANATGRGHGGRITLLSRGRTVQAGAIQARGAGGGSGGWVEVSGAQVSLGGVIDTSAAGGARAGTILIDPMNICVVAGTSCGMFTGSYTQITPAMFGAFIGDVILKADGQLLIESAITANNNATSLDFEGDQGISIDAAISAMGKPVAFYSPGGSIVMGAAGQIVAGSIAASAASGVQFASALNGNAFASIDAFSNKTSSSLSGTVVTDAYTGMPRQKDTIAIDGIAAGNGALALNDADSLTIDAPLSATGDITVDVTTPGGTASTLAVNADVTGQDVTLTVAPPLTFTGQALSVAKATTVQATGITGTPGTLTLNVAAGTLAIAGTLLTGADAAHIAGTITLTAGSVGAPGEIVQAATSSLRTGTLTGSATGNPAGKNVPHGDAFLTSATNTVTTLNGFTTSGTFTLIDTAALAVAGPVAAASGDITLTANTLAIGADLTGGTIALNSTGKNVTGTAITIASGSTVDAQGSLLIVEALSGDIAIDGTLETATKSGVTATATASLTALGGSIMESATTGLVLVGILTDDESGTLKKGQLGTSGGETLTAAGNAVTTLGPITTGGTFALTDAAPLTVAGAVTATSGNVTLTVSATGATPLIVDANITGATVVLDTLGTGMTGTAFQEAKTATIDATTGSLVIETVSGDIAFAGTLETGNRTSGTASLTALAGNIIEDKTTGHLFVGVLTDDKTGTAGNADLESTSNSIMTLGALNVGGALTIEDNIAPFIAGPITVGGAFTLVGPGTAQPAGLLVIGGTVGAGSIDWNAAGGILELTGASVTGTQGLVLTSGGAIVQQSGALLASPGAAGTITLTADGSTTFTGAYKSLGTIAGIAFGGRITAGTLASGIYSGGVTLAAPAGSITEALPGAAASGVIQAGALTASASGSVALTTTSGTTGSTLIGNQVATLAAGSAGSAFTLVDGQNLSITGALKAARVALTAPTLTVAGTGAITLTGNATSSLVADQFQIDAGGTITGGATTLTFDRLHDGTFTIVGTIGSGDTTDTIGTDSIGRIALAGGTIAFGSTDGAHVYDDGGTSTGTLWGASSGGSITDLRILAPLDITKTAAALGLFSDGTIENFAQGSASSNAITVTTLYGAAGFDSSNGKTLGIGTVSLLDVAGSASNAIGTLLAFDTASTGVATASPAFTLQDGVALKIAGPVDARNGAVLLQSTSNVTLAGPVTGTDVFVAAGGSIDQTGNTVTATGAAASRGTIGLDASGSITLAGALDAGPSGSTYLGAVLLQANTGDIDGASGTVRAGTLAAAASGNITLTATTNTISVVGSLSSSFAGLLTTPITLYGLFSGGTGGIGLTDAIGLTIADNSGTNPTVSALGTSTASIGTISINVINGGTLTLGTTNGATIEAYGDITLIADGTILQNGGIVESLGILHNGLPSTGSVAVQSRGGNIVQLGGTFRSDLADVHVAALGSIEQTGAAITAAYDATLLAGADITQTLGAIASTITGAHGVQLQAGGNVISTLGTIASAGIANDSSSGTVTISAGGSIAFSGLIAGGGSLAGSLFTPAAASAVLLDAMGGDVTETVAGQTTGVVLAGTLAAAAAGNLLLNDAALVTSAAGSLANQIGTIASLSATFANGTTIALKGLSADGATGIALDDLAALTVADGAVVTASAGSLSITVRDATGATQPTLTLGTAAGATLTAAGNITLISDGTLAQHGGSATSQNGSLTVQSVHADVLQDHGIFVAETQSVSVMAAGTITQVAGQISAATDAALTAGGDIVQYDESGIVAGGNVVLTAAGNITQSGMLYTAGDMAGHDRIRAGAAAALTAGQAITQDLAGSIAAGTTATLTAGGDIVQYGQSTISAGGNAMLLAGCLAAGNTGCASASASGGNIVQSAATPSAGDVAGHDSIAAGGNLTLMADGPTGSAGGTITQDGNSTIVAGGSATVIGLAAPGGAFAGSFQQTAGSTLHAAGTLLLGFAGDIAIGGTVAAGTLTLVSSHGNVTETVAGATTGIIQTGTLAAVADGGSLLLGNAANAIATIAPLGAAVPGLVAGGAIVLADSEALAQQGGTISAGSSITIAAAGFSQSAGATLFAPGLVHIASALAQSQASLSGGAVQIDGNVTQFAAHIAATGAVGIGGTLAQNQSTLTAGADAQIAGQVTQTASNISAGGAVGLGVGLVQTASTLTAGAGVSIMLDAVQNAASLIMANAGSITIGGRAIQSASTIDAIGDVQIGDVAQTAGARIAATGNVTIARSLTQADSVVSGNVITIGGARDSTLTQTGNSLIQGTSVQATLGGAFQQSAGGTIVASQNLLLASSGGNMDFAGLIQGDTVALTASNGIIAEQAGGVLLAGNAATLSGTAIQQAGLIQGNQVALTATAGDIVESSGTLVAGQFAASATGNLLLASATNTIGAIAPVAGLAGLTAGNTIVLQDAQSLSIETYAAVTAPTVDLATAQSLLVDGTIAAAVSLIASAQTDLTEGIGAAITAGSARLLAPDTITLMGSTTAASLLLAADTQGDAAQAVDWNGGALTTASLPPPAGALQGHTYSITMLPHPGQPGILVRTRNFIQTGTTTVGGTGPTAALTISLAGAGSIIFQHLLAPRAQLLLDLTGGGTAGGTIDVAGLNAFYSLAALPRQPTLLLGTVAGLGGVAAAGVSFAEQHIGGSFQPIGNINYQINGCALGSSNCVLLSPIVVPVINPIPDISLHPSGRRDDDELLPNVAEEDY